MKVGDFIVDDAAADRFRPHRRADRQAGDRAEGARSRAQAPVRGVQGPHGRDHQRPRQARRIRQRHGRSRPRRSAAAARRTAAARDLPQRRPRARLHLRRARGAARPADLPVAHPSAIHGQAVRPGSAGDLRRHHRDQGGGARSRQPRQDRAWSRATAASIRSAPASACAAAASRRWCRSCRARRSTSSPGRRTGDLRRQRAGAGRGHQGRAGRGCRPHRSRGAGRPAIAGDRPPRPERAPRLAAHRLGHRHPDRGARNPSAGRKSSAPARRCSSTRSTSTT